MSKPITPEEARFIKELVADAVGDAYEETIQTNAKQSAHDHYEFVANLFSKMDTFLCTVDAIQMEEFLNE